VPATLRTVRGEIPGSSATRRTGRHSVGTSQGVMPQESP
jgi:hypothetical protein